jgi:hypothetical protein
MEELLQQIPTLIGVALGALASYLTAFSNERTKWRREHRLRQSEKQSTVYAEYGRAVKEMYQRTMHLAHSSGLPAFGPDIAVAEARAELARANHARAVQWENVLLLGSDSAIAAARRWHESIWHMERIAAEEQHKVDEWMTARDASNMARSEFYAAAREDLGVSSGVILQN